MKEQLGNRIKKLRLEKGIPQKVLAESIGISTSTIGMYEQNRRVPDADTLVKLSTYFGVTIDYLLGNEKTPIADDNGRITNELTDLLSDVSEERIEKILQYIQLFDKIPDDKIPQALEFLEYLSKSK